MYCHCSRNSSSNRYRKSPNHCGIHLKVKPGYLKMLWKVTQHNGSVPVSTCNHAGGRCPITKLFYWTAFHSGLVTHYQTISGKLVKISSIRSVQHLQVLFSILSHICSIHLQILYSKINIFIFHTKTFTKVWYKCGLTLRWQLFTVWACQQMFMYLTYQL